MKIDLTSRIAAITLSLLFLSNDLLATTHALLRTPEPIGQVATRKQVSTQPQLKSDAAYNEVLTNEVDPADIPYIDYLSDHSIAYLGGHANDPMQKPHDDVFDIVIAEDPEEFRYAYLLYEVYGLENGADLPKSINGSLTYHGNNSYAGEGWDAAIVRVDLADLVVGNNTVRFALPNDARFPVQVKNIKIRLSKEPIGNLAVQARANRAVASLDDFAVLKDEEEPALGYKLSKMDVPSIPVNLTNLTRNAVAYRFDGEPDQAYRVAIGVDKGKLTHPGELTQVQIFYFDRETRSWKVVHTERVDQASNQVEGTVPGGTDYFAGLIKTPEMPEASAYLPTAISDIEPANPATGMRMMEPPSANRMGSAGISYPLWIPQGRSGMAPQLAVTYNSDAGTGWMGLGWNIATSSISVDTKWGVPEYDTQIETEPYVLDGEALFMEGNNRANRPTLDGNGDVVPLGRESGTVRFFPRVMSSYSEIERKGSSPSNYYWIVTDASQTKRYYGTIDGAAQDTNSVLKTNSGEVAQWYLKRVEDKWGNTIDYEYELFEEGTTSNMKSGGKNRILEKITYTGYNGTSYVQGKYRVEFHTSDSRNDAKVSMNFGLKHVDDRRLDSISVFYDTQAQSLVRYKFTYNRSKQTFFKTVLASLQEYRNGQFFYEHTFDYYEDPIDYEQSVVLDANKPDPWLKGSSDVSFFEPIREGVLRVLSPSAINTSLTRGYSVGGSLGAGFSLSQAQNKNGTFSVGIGFDQNWTSATRTMRDINGDGLADLLYEDYDGNFSYSPIYFENGQFTVGAHREFGTKGVQRSTSTSFKTNIDYRSATGYFVGFNWNTSTTKVKRSLTDYNADGVPDLIIDDGTSRPVVQFGLRDSKGDVSFSRSSEHTLNPVIKGLDFNLEDDGDLIKEFQVVKIWKAPADGQIWIKGVAAVRAGLSGEGAVAIQHNSTFITQAFETVKPGLTYVPNHQINVNKGDLILFRTISREDGQEDFIEWNPTVEYTSGSFTDGNGTSWWSSTSAEGFLLSGREGVSVEGDREFKIDLNLSVSSALSDDVYLVLQPYIDGVPQSPITDRLPIGGPYTTPNLNAYDFVGGYDSFDNYTGYSSTDNVSFKFSLWSTSNVDWDQIEFRPVVKFDDDCKVANEQYPVVDYETYNEIEILEGLQTRTSTSTTYYEVIPEIKVITNDINSVFGFSSQDEEGIVYMTVKSDGDFLSRVAVRFIRDHSTPSNNAIKVHPMTASTGVIDFGTNLSFSTYNNDPDVKFLGSQIVSDKLFVEFHGTGPAAKQMAKYINTHLYRLKFLSTGSSQTIGGTDPNRNIYYRTFNEFNMHYLSWGRFVWSPTDDQLVETALDTSELHSLVMDEVQNGSIDLTDSTSIANNRDYLNPMNHNFFAMGATRGEKEFGLRSYHKALGSGEALDRYSVFGTYMGEYKAFSGVSSGYLGEEELDVETLEDEPGINPSYTAKGILDYSRSSTLGITGGFEHVATVGAHFSDKNVLYSRSKKLFMDINGDGYPDVLNENDDEVTIYRTNAFGSHTSGTTTHGLHDFLEKGTSWGTMAGVESGAFINNDKRFEALVDKNQIVSLGSISLGYHRSRSSFVDVNGDGLPDEFYDDQQLTSSTPPVFALNNGTQMESHTFFAQDRISTANYIITPNVEHLLDVLIRSIDNEASRSSKSWEIGANVNYSVNQSRRIYLDLTGDGLVDYLEYDTDFFNDKVKIYINDGDGFSYYEEISTDPIDEQINKNTGLGFAVKLTGTGAFSLWGLKIKGSLTGNGNVSVNRLQNSFMDMNGDGVPDYVEHSGQGDLQVYFAKFGRTGKLKTVHNPIGGSFTINYDSEGQKSGYYEPQVKTHLSDATNEKMIWDMPQGRLVMSEVTIDDGRDVVDGSSDLDGVDEMHQRFAYDGGIYSRREREFLGFTRVATMSGSHIDEITKEEYLNDYCDYGGIEEPRDLSDLYEEPFEAGTSKVEPLRRYNMSVSEYMRPTSLDKDELFAFTYLSKLPAKQYDLHVHEWQDSVEVCVRDNPPPSECTPIGWDKFDLSHAALISETNPGYEIRLVDTDPVSVTFGEVLKESGEWVVVQNLNTLGEASTIFPAVLEMRQANFPVVYDHAYYNASKMSMEYDEYFNVIQYEDEGTGVATTPDTLVVDTMYYTRYVYKSQINSCTILTTLDTVYNDGLVYGLSVPSNTLGYDDAVIFGLFGPSVCLSDSIPTPILWCDEGISSFVTQHRGVRVDTIYIREVHYNATYSGRLIAQMDYFTPAQASGRTNALKEHRIYSGSTAPQNLKRHTEVSSLEAGKAPAEIKKHLSPTEVAVTNIGYDTQGMGNVVSVEGPANLNNQRATTTFTYDTEVHQFVEGISNAYGESICNHYDYATGLLLKKTDVNGHPTRYEYDDYYRLSKVWAPRELYNDEAAATVEFKYHPWGIDSSSVDPNKRVPVALTLHNTGNNVNKVYSSSQENPCDTSDLSQRPTITDAAVTATFIDGIARPIQIQTENSRSVPNTIPWINESVLRVSGFTEYNKFGQAIAQRADFLDPTGTLGTFVADSSAVISTIQYDYLHREDSMFTLSPNNGQWLQTDLTYDWLHFSGNYYFVQGSVSDQTVTNQKFLDSRGRTIVGIQDNTVVTQFEYDALGQMINSKDPIDQITTYQYDNLGRVTQEVHPDRGETNMSYDLSGNVIEIENPATDPEAIQMDYYFNRLTSKTMPSPSGSNDALYDVTYSYGYKDDGKNGAGRVTTVNQGYDFKVESYAYNELGQLHSESKQIAVPNLGSKSYLTEFVHDSFGRILKMTYPDGDSVRYHYTSHGELERMSLTEDTVISRITYDGYGNIHVIRYGNGTVTGYGYIPDIRQLSGAEVLAKPSGGTSLVWMSTREYSYNTRGMVSKFKRTVHSSIVPSASHAEHEFAYTYDDMNRLTNTTLDFDLSTPATFDYSLDMTYNAAGGITLKTSDVLTGGTPVNGSMDYVLEYYYDETKEHQISTIEDSPSGVTLGYEYNASGSVEKINENMEDEREAFFWNEEQWLMGVRNVNGVHHYIYDQNGERIMKSSVTIDQVEVNGENINETANLAPYTLYVNPYYVVTEFTDADKVSKHYYMGMQRVASELITESGEEFSAKTSTTQDSLSLSESAVWQNLQNVLSHFGMEENEDYTMEELQNQPALRDYYPDAEPESMNKMDGPGNRVMYWYHPDYLGNVELVTDNNGEVNEFFFYNPWGESLYEWNNGTSDFSSPYRFSGKELDPETGLHYYGARYYNSRTSIWLSVDPLTSDFPHFTPYNFSENNPIMLVDPNGMFATEPERLVAVATARRYVSMNTDPKGSTGYGWAEKGSPGSKVDCSGLISYCIRAAGLQDPTSLYNEPRGVLSIIKASRELALNDIVPGNAVVIDWNKEGGSPHIGLVTEVQHDENGNVVGFSFAHSSSSNGPVVSEYTEGGSGYYDDEGLYSGFYAWDSEGPSLTMDGIRSNIHSSLAEQFLQTHVLMPNGEYAELYNPELHGPRDPEPLIQIKPKEIKNIIEW